MRCRLRFLDGWEGGCELHRVVTLNPKNDLDDHLIQLYSHALCVRWIQKCHTFEVKKWEKSKRLFTHFADGDIGVAKNHTVFSKIENQ